MYDPAEGQTRQHSCCNTTRAADRCEEEIGRSCAAYQSRIATHTRPTSCLFRRIISDVVGRWCQLTALCKLISRTTCMAWLAVLICHVEWSTISLAFHQKPHPNERRLTNLMCIAPAAVFRVAVLITWSVLLWSVERGSLYLTLANVYRFLSSFVLF